MSGLFILFNDRWKKMEQWLMNARNETLRRGHRGNLALCIWKGRVQAELKSPRDNDKGQTSVHVARQRCLPMGPTQSTRPCRCSHKIFEKTAALQNPQKPPRFLPVRPLLLRPFLVYPPIIGSNYSTE